MSIFAGLFGGGGGIAHGGAGGSAAIPPVPVTADSPADLVANAKAAAAAAAGDPISSSLDGLKSFWDTPKDAEGKPLVAPVDPTSTDIFNFDPAKITASAKTLDFTKGLDPALVSQALGGDSAAFMAVINHATQTAFAAATVNTGKMINKSHVDNNDRVRSTLPSAIKRVQLDQTTTINPVLQHEAAQPLVTALKQMAFAKDPNANPADVTKQVEALLMGLGSAMAASTPDAIAARQVVKPGEQDWSTFL